MRARSVRAASAAASWPSPERATVLSSPSRVARAAGTGVVKDRPSAKPETAQTTTGRSARTARLQLTRCGAPKPSAGVPFGP
ncbi:hypothetical protein [Streptomyces sp. CLI2509]|uniref:hypothetical protein n=1 Tax=Streptomyces sp. CLI2509 TaxID=1984801 RepID=UPI00131B7EA4|nr:hypothetical protein [Streptomyces sp. CLI2509]